MEGSSASYAAFIGIDVAKATFDVALDETSTPFTLAYDDAGVSQLLERVRPLGHCLVVLEASGGLERRLATELAAAGQAVAIVNPRQVRDYARGIGQRAKTDRLDALVLARFAREVRPAPWTPPSEKQGELQDLVARRRQLLHLHTIETNRRAHVSVRIRQSIDAVLQFFGQQIADLDAAIAALIESDDDWRHKAELLESVPGIGATTSRTLLAELPELGQLNRQAVAALAGVAPYNDDSGPRSGHRTISGGRKRVRCCLYMAALTARRCNPLIRRFATRLTDAGKPYKVVATACIRKLLIIVNAMLKQNRPWKFSPEIAR